MSTPYPTDRDLEITEDKALRRDLDAQPQRVKALPPTRERSICITKLQEAVMWLGKALPPTRERSICITKLQEAVRWLGMDLKRLATPDPYPDSKDPYPDSKDPSNTTIQPTADGLKL